MSNARRPSNVPDFVNEHLQRYLDSDGEDGHLWDSSGFGDHGFIPTLLLTSLGWKSGEALVLPLIYGRTDDGYVVVASSGGSPGHPAWYQNLDANPQVTLQVKADRFAAEARTTKGEERKQLWTLMTGIYPTYVELQEKTDREIPVVLLTALTR